LREILERISPGNGGDARPSEYFDIIGASGPNALAALLFVKFVGDPLYVSFLSPFSLITGFSVSQLMKLLNFTTIYPLDWTRPKMS
jgi:hypothetical protein